MSPIALQPFSSAHLSHNRLLAFDFDPCPSRNSKSALKSANRHKRTSDKATIKMNKIGRAMRFLYPMLQKRTRMLLKKRWHNSTIIIIVADAAFLVVELYFARHVPERVIRAIITQQGGGRKIVFQPTLDVFQSAQFFFVQSIHMADFLQKSIPVDPRSCRYSRMRVPKTIWALYFRCDIIPPPHPPTGSNSSLQVILIIGHHKLRTYREFKTEYRFESYLNQVQNTEHRRALTKLRISDHILEVGVQVAEWLVGLSPMRPGFDSRIGIPHPGVVSEKGLVPVCATRRPWVGTLSR